MTIAVTDDEADLIQIFDNVDPMDEHQEVFPNAEPPTLEDLEWSDADYTIGPGDELAVSVIDLYAEGQEAILRRVVSNAGYIDMPYLPRLQVRGLTLHQMAEAIRQAYQPDYLLNPVVSVVPMVKRENHCFISGAVARPGRYGVPRRDYRLLEAITEAGDANNPNLEYAYVLRRTEAAESLRRPSSPSAVTPVPMTPEDLPPLPGIDPTPAAPADPAAAPADPEGDDLLQQLQQYMPGTDEAPTPPTPETLAPQPPAPAVQPVAPAATDAAAPAPDAEMDALRGAMTPGAAVPATQPMKPTTLHFSENEAPVAASADAPPAAAQLEWVVRDGQWVQVPTGGGDAAPAVDPDDPFGWAQADMSNLTRIIAINLTSLKEGNPRQNIVIRDGDMIIVPPMRIGAFYITGEVVQSGEFPLTGRKLTVKMAMAMARGMNDRAWPSNSVLVRRIGTDQELRLPLRLDLIMAGKEPEILLKPDDVIMVGTHILSPFLAVARNAFRMTYGFGFYYDRNFSEKNFGQFNGFEDLFE